MQVLLTTCAAWYLRQTARAFNHRGSLAGLWITDGNRGAVPDEKYRRCWPFHLAMKPFYHLTTQHYWERLMYAFVPIWKTWLRYQLRGGRRPEFDVAQAIMGFGHEGFQAAEQIGALKVVDAPNSHPTSYFGYWQRELDIWCPGDSVPIPRKQFARMNRDLERADVVLCPSTFVRDTMVTNGIPEEKCFVKPFGVDTSIFKKRTEVPNSPRFISVGSVGLRKGHQYLFPAFEILRRQFPAAELICVGAARSDFRREMPKWEGRFVYYPHRTHQQLAELLPTCSAFVLGSVEEGFARVLSEAMAAGLPVIATYETGAGTLVDDGVEGFIVPARHPEKLAEAMLKLAADRELNKAMGERAYLKGAVRNTWQDYGDRLLAEYQRRLEMRKANV